MSVFSDRRPEAHRLPQTEHVSDASWRNHAIVCVLCSYVKVCLCVSLYSRDGQVNAEELHKLLAENKQVSGGGEKVSAWCDHVIDVFGLWRRAWLAGTGSAGTRSSRWPSERSWCTRTWRALSPTLTWSLCCWLPPRRHRQAPRTGWSTRPSSPAAGGALSIPEYLYISLLSSVVS